MNSGIVFQIKTAAIVFGYFLCLAIPVVVIIGSALYNSVPKDLDASGYEDDREGEQS